MIRVTGQDHPPKITNHENLMPNNPKKYGRQGNDKTIKSVSLDRDLAKLGKEAADRAGTSFSAWINDLLRDKIGSHPPQKKK